MLFLDELEPLVGQTPKVAEFGSKSATRTPPSTTDSQTVCYSNLTERVPVSMHAFRSQLRAVLASLLPAIVALVAMGSYFGIAILTKDKDSSAQSSFLLPFPLLVIPLAMNWAWARDRRTVERWPNLRISNWWLFAIACAASYSASFLPRSLLEATVLTTMISVPLWLVVVQLYRSLLRERARTRIAEASGLEVNDLRVTALANNNDLANAAVVTAFASAEIWLLTTTDTEWAPVLSIGMARTIAFVIGWTLGLAHFAWCPNQSDIRELISQSR